MRQYSRSLFEDMLMIDNGDIPKSHWKVNEPVATFVSCYFCHLYVVSPKTQVGVIDRSAHTIEPTIVRDLAPLLHQEKTTTQQQLRTSQKKQAE